MAHNPDVAPESGDTTTPTTTPVTTTTRKRSTAKKSVGSEPAGAESEAQTAKKAPTRKSSAAKTTATAKKTPAKKAPAKKAAAKKTAATKKAAPGQPDFQAGESGSETPPSTAEGAPATGLLFQPPPAERAPRKRTSKAAQSDDQSDGSSPTTHDGGGSDESGADSAPVKKTSAKKTTAKKSGATRSGGKQRDDDASAAPASDDTSGDKTGKAGVSGDAPDAERATSGGDGDQGDDTGDDSGDDSGQGGNRRRRRRGGRRRGRKNGSDGDQNGSEGDQDSSEGDQDSSGGHSDSDSDSSGKGEKSDDSGSDSPGEGGGSASSRRRRRRRRSGEGGGDGSSDDPDNTVTRVRSPRSAEDEITAFTGSTRLEAKKQRRREGREAGRRRAPVISEAEFLARRESVERAMVIRQRKDLTQIAVLEDKVLVEHYVARESQTSLIGNVYLGKVQNVLPSMEAAFIDIGRGRNAVLYAGEVNWDALGAGNVSGKDRKIEQVLKPGQAVLVQVSKDPIGHKGARLTSQISLPGRFLVYVPEGNTSGISRKLPDTERNRLKTLLKEIVPSEAGVIVRTAAEGAAEEELRRDVSRLKARWEDISAKVESGSGSAPTELYSEPDLTLKVVRDLFTEDFAELVVSGDDAWEMVSSYVEQVAPDLSDRLTKHDDTEGDAFTAHRIDEQINKALDRKVWLPSGGSLIIDRTEAMTVVDVNTGKFTGSGGNLEETVTKNNLEAAEEIVRQLRLRDIGGIIVIDFIDMVLESNRELVLRRLIECLGRDRTRHQVAEVTSLGLVQMTRKRIGTGLLEAFSETCDHCQGRGVHVHAEPVEPKKSRQDDDSRRGRRGRGGKSDGDNAGNGGNGGGDNGGGNGSGKSGGSGKGKQGGKNKSEAKQEEEGQGKRPSPAEFAAMAAHKSDETDDSDAGDSEVPDATPDTSAEAKAEPTESSESTEQPPAPVDSTPRIVTSTRRRGATRAAGSPRTPEPSTSTEATASTQPADSTEPTQSERADRADRADSAERADRAAAGTGGQHAEDRDLDPSPRCQPGRQAAWRAGACGSEPRGRHRDLGLR